MEGVINGGKLVESGHIKLTFNTIILYVPYYVHMLSHLNKI